MSLTAQGLTVAFPSANGPVKVLEDFSLVLSPSETLALIGESGAGKSVFIETVLGLLPEGCTVSGSVVYEGRDLLKLRPDQLRPLLGQELAWVPQSATQALHPMLPLEVQLSEGLIARGIPKPQARQRVHELLEALDLRPAQQVARQYPHQLSGGMRQRAMLVAALAQNPKVLLVDEPTKGVDTERKQQVAELLRQTQRPQPELATLVVTHDLELVRAIADRVMVLYAGQTVEASSATDFFQAPKHPFAQALLAALPQYGLQALPWTESRSVQGCRFHTRCPRAMERCKTEEPPLISHAQAEVRCWLYAD